MPLTDALRQRVRSMAAAAGFDPDEAETMADEMSAQPRAAAEDPKAAPAPPKPQVASAEAPKVFQYHLPYLRVREVRALVGMTERVEDDDDFTGPWLAKHGGPASAAPNPATPDGAA